MRDVDLYSVGQEPEELQRAIIDLRNDFDSHIHDGTSSKLFETIQAQTFAAQTISIRKTSYTSSVAGLWAGMVDGDIRFSLGSSTNYLKWDGSSLSIVGNISGSTITGGTFQTASSGQRIVIDNSNTIKFYSGLENLVGTISGGSTTDTIDLQISGGSQAWLQLDGNDINLLNSGTSLNNSGTYGIGVSLVPGEDIASLDPVRIGYDTSILFTKINQDVATSSFQFARDSGRVLNVKYIAQSFVLQKNETISTIDLKFQASGNDPGGRQPAINIGIQSDSSGSPDGTYLFSSGYVQPNYAQSYPGPDPIIQTFTMSSPTEITANTTYWIVMTVKDDDNNGIWEYLSGATDGNLYYNIVYNGNGTVYPDGVMKYKSTSVDSWTDGGVSRDLYFVIKVQEVPGRVYKALATTQSYIDRYLGLAGDSATYSSGDYITKIYNSGIVLTSGLTIGSTYFVSDIGTLATSQGTIKKQVGVALSTASLLVVDR